MIANNDPSEAATPPSVACGSWELLYLVQAGEEEVKIGVTRNVPARIAALQTGNPKTIKPVRVWHHPFARRIETAILSACHMNVTRGEWLDLEPDHATTLVEVVIGSFEVTHCKEIVTDKPEAAYTSYTEHWSGEAVYCSMPVPRWMKNIKVTVTTATGKQFVCEFSGKPGFGNKDYIARTMRERPHGWMLRRSEPS